jgi:hypothetical protein
VLPHQDEFSSPQAFHLASGPANWNQQQGFYIYRASRMIQSGGWSNLRAPDEHTKLARVAVSFSPALDEAFKINVAKMRVQMPVAVRDEIRAAIAPVLKLARDAYDHKSAKPQIVRPSQNAATDMAPRPQASAPPPLPRDGPIGAARESDPATLPRLRTAAEWSAELLALATEAEKPVVQAVLARLPSTGVEGEVQ